MKISDSDLQESFDKIANCEDMEWDDTWNLSSVFAKFANEPNNQNIKLICLSKLDSEEKWERLFAMQILWKSQNSSLVPPSIITRIFDDIGFFWQISLIINLIARKDDDSIGALKEIKHTHSGIFISLLIYVVLFIKRVLS